MNLHETAQQLLAHADPACRHDRKRLESIAAEVGYVFVKHEAVHSEILAIVACILQVIADKERARQ